MGKNLDIKSKLFDILIKNKSLASNNKILWLAYLEKYHEIKKLFVGNVQYSKFKEFVKKSDIPDPESISREKRRMIALGQIKINGDK